VSGSSSQELEAAVKNDIEIIKDYYESNGLKINLNKSKYMIFGNKMMDTLSGFMKRNGIEQVTTIKYLGYELDSRLKFNDHVDSILEYLNRLTLLKF
jgi:hypothetical protein